MRTGAKTLLVLGGFIAAAAIAAAVVAYYIAQTSGPDRTAYAAMYDFGDLLLFLAVFAVASIPAAGAALYFLRPWQPLWRLLSIAAIFSSLASLASAVAYAMRSSYAWIALAPLGIFAAPATALLFLLSGIFAPTR